jgi:hypothetical protein
MLWLHEKKVATYDEPIFKTNYLKDFENVRYTTILKDIISKPSVQKIKRKTPVRFKCA